MIRRELNDELKWAFNIVRCNCERGYWGITDRELTQFYKYIFADLVKARTIMVEDCFYNELLFDDGSVHYFENTRGDAIEADLSEEQLETKIYLHPYGVIIQFTSFIRCVIIIM